MKVPEEYTSLLPANYDLDRIEYNKVGSFAQLLVDGVLVGYIMLGDNPTFKPKGSWKG
ncbi:hypothetical protein V5097_11635 [Arenibacter palladensis]